MLGNESERVQMIRFWYGMSTNITYHLVLQSCSTRILRRGSFLAAAEIVEGMLNRADASRQTDSRHKCQSCSCHYNDNMEWHKYCNIPRHRGDRLPVPVPQLTNDEHHEHGGLPPHNWRRWERSSQCTEHLDGYGYTRCPFHIRGQNGGSPVPNAPGTGNERGMGWVRSRGPVPDPCYSLDLGGLHIDA